MKFNTLFSCTNSIRHNKKIIFGGVILTLLIIIACQKSTTPPDEVAAFTFDAEAKLRELGITLPEPPKPVANYVNGVRTGNLIFLAGKGPKRADGSEITGKLG